MMTEASICHTTVSKALSAASRPTSLHASRPPGCAAPLLPTDARPTVHHRADNRLPVPFPPTGDRT